MSQIIQPAEHHTLYFYQLLSGREPYAPEWWIHTTNNIGITPLSMAVWESVIWVNGDARLLLEPKTPDYLAGSVLKITLRYDFALSAAAQWMRFVLKYTDAEVKNNAYLAQAHALRSSLTDMTPSPRLVDPKHLHALPRIR